MQIPKHTSSLNSSYLMIAFIYSEQCYKVRSHLSGLIQGVGQAAQLIHHPSSSVLESLASTRCFLTSFLPHKPCSGGCRRLLAVLQLMQWRMRDSLLRQTSSDSLHSDAASSFLGGWYGKQGVV